MPIMKIESVFVQSENGVPTDEAFHKAYHGFNKRRIKCELVEAQRIEDGSLPLSKTSLVAGGLRTVESAMEQIGMKVPTANNLPDELKKYFGRTIEKTTLGVIRERWNSGTPEPCFIKPLTQNKGFPGIALFNLDDLKTLNNLPGDVGVIVSEYVLFDSEWRIFVCNEEIVGISHYQGDWFCFPDKSTIESAIRDFKSAPAGYGIDFGVLSSGQTVIVESNDGYSLGAYSLNSVDYSRLLEARWLELAA